MKLESMWVHGFRRFGGDEPVRLRLDSPLVCLVGANEVGKSTLLDALELVERGTDEDDEWIPVPQSEWTRGEDLPDDREIIRLRYRLSPDERKKLKALQGGKQLRNVRWLERCLEVDGEVSARLLPTPVRNKEPRHRLAAEIQEAQQDGEWLAEQPDEGPTATATINVLVKALESNMMYISDQLPVLKALIEYIEENGGDISLIERMQAVHEHESLDHPLDEGLSALTDLIPRFVRFEIGARQLADEYDLNAVASSPPPALHNLAELAELDLQNLREQIRTGLTGSVRDTLNAANAVLKKEFAAWQQDPAVTVGFDRSGTQLLVHVQSGSGPSMKPGERSEGLRQFVALVALMAGEGHQLPPILLIDEAEMHLHYDAQADLMDVLSIQKNAAQVIYTTHSAACLPEDLGSSVRVVHGVGDQMRSSVNQQFWSDDPGLVPLLLAMGAGSMAFVPLRPAAIVEGGSDLVLLPSLIKEAARIPRLGYQVVPGAAGVPPLQVAGLDLHGVRTVWVLDGDKGGRDRRRYLASQGVPEDRIHLLVDGQSGVDLEDLIHPATYARAVSNYAEDLGTSAEFGEDELPKEPCRRHAAVEAWCEKNELKKPGKTAIANKVLELRGELPLGDPDRGEVLRTVHKAMRKQVRKQP